MQPYLQRYEALQQERLRGRQARASDALFSSPASAATSDGFERALAPPPRDYNEVAAATDDDGVFDFAAAQSSPPPFDSTLAQSTAALSVASDEFVDAGAC